MAESFLLSLPSLFPTKTQHPHFSTLPSNSLKLHLSSIKSSPFLIKRTHFSSSISTFVAQTSDWAHQEAENTVSVGGNDDTEAAVSDWEADGVEDEVEYEEPPEDAKLYVGNLPFDVDSQKLAMLFEQAGTVEIAEVR